MQFFNIQEQEVEFKSLTLTPQDQSNHVKKCGKEERNVGSVLFGDSLVVPEKGVSNINNHNKLGRRFRAIEALFMEGER